MTNSPHPLGTKGWGVALAVVLLVAAALRLVNLTSAPPGLNQDEAANAWNAYCLLKTGQDQAGARWPIFHSRCLGENRCTLYFYLLLPFQAVGGLNVWTTRLPSATGGIATVLLLYVVGARLFGRPTGLLAAALLAVNPWHLQQSRWGHEAGLTPLLVVLPIAAWLWANLLPGHDQHRQARLIRAALAGVVTGICCYGYPAVRVFLPVFLLLAVAVTWRGWWALVQTRRGAAAIALLLAGLAMTFGPLAYQHLTEPEVIGRRGQTTWVWEPSDSTGTKITKALARYPGHFGLDFLFRKGDVYEVQSPPDMGLFHWYMLPLMVLGAASVIRRSWSSPAARLLLVWVLVYPIGDCFNLHASLHALRSLPGVAALVLLAGVGCISVLTWLHRRRRALAVAAACALGVAVISLNARYLPRFFGEYNRRPLIYHSYHVDLLEACEWLRPRFDQLDAVFCTTTLMNQPYIITLVGLRYPPEQWFRDTRDVQTGGVWDVYTRYGKMHFVYGNSANGARDQLVHNGRLDRVVIIARPREFGLNHPTHAIRRPDGEAVLWIVEQQF